MSLTVSSGQASGVYSGSGGTAGFVALSGDATGRIKVSPSFSPLETGGQRVSIGAASARSTACTVGSDYLIIAEADCYIAEGPVTVDATNASFFLMAGQYLRWTPSTGNDYLAVIRSLTDAANGLHICRVS